MARYSTERKEETRRRILGEAQRLLISSGPDSIAIASLMSALELTHGGFYAHFESREELIELAAVELCATATATLVALAQEMSPLEALKTYLSRYLSAEHRDAQRAACPIITLTPAIDRMGLRARRHYHSAYGKLVAELARLLKQAGAAHAEDTAASILAEMVGALSIARALGQGKDSLASLRRSQITLKERLDSVCLPAPGTKRKLLRTASTKT